MEIRKTVTAKNLTEERETGYTETIVLADEEMKVEEIPAHNWSDYEDFVILYGNSNDEYELTVSYTEADGDFWKEEPTESYTELVRVIAESIVNDEEKIANLFSELSLAIQDQKECGEEEAEDSAFRIFKTIIEEVQAGNITEENKEEKIGEIAIKEGLKWF